MDKAPRYTGSRKNYKLELLKSASGIYLRETLSRRRRMNYRIYIPYPIPSVPTSPLPLSLPQDGPPVLLGHTELRRETRGLSAKIYFFIPAHLVALLSEVNILFNLFTSGKTSPAKARPRNFARELQRRGNFRRVSRAPPLC